VPARMRRRHADAHRIITPHRKALAWVCGYYRTPNTDRPESPSHQE